MGILTGEELTDEIRALIGREGSGTKGVITDARVTRWINEAQDRIEEECPGLPDLDFRNPDVGDATTAVTHTLVTDQIRYSIADLTFSGNADYNDLTDEKVAWIYNIWHVRGSDSTKLRFMPLDEFDRFLIDPTSSEVVTDRPTRWTKRGGNIEIAPRPSSTYNGDPLRVDGMRTAQDFTTNDATASEIGNVDEGIIYYGVAKAWGAIGEEARSQIWMKKFTNPRRSDDIGWIERFRDKYAAMEAWDAGLYTPVTTPIIAGN